MSMRLHELQALMMQDGSPAYTDDKEVLVYPFVHKGEMFNVFAELTGDGGYARFRIPFYLNLMNSRDPEAFRVKLLQNNLQYKALKFSVDPEDGEVVVSIEIAFVEGVLHASQVQHALWALTYLAMQERDNLRTLQDTGIYPTDDDPAFQETVERLIEDAPRGDTRKRKKK